MLRRRRYLLNTFILSRSGGFSPRSLFAAGEVGAWYDPSDLTTLYQDTAGTQPVTAAGQSVALVRDKSGRGNHATQGTAASMPIYSVVPQTGRRNLLTYTEQFDNAAWTKHGASTITANSTTSPDGSSNADTVNAAASEEGPYKNVTVTSGAVYTCSVYLKSSASLSSVLFRDDMGAGRHIAIRLSDGAITETAGALLGYGSTHVGNGWYRVWMSYAADSTGLRFWVRSSATAGTFYIWGAQLETGTTATAYQRVVSQYDVTESGVASRHYLAFDGIDDWLQTSTITPGTDKAQVFAGVRKLSDAAGGLVAELSSGVGNDGSLALFAPSAAAANYLFSTRGSADYVNVSYTNAAVAAPVTNILTCTADIAGDSGALRVDGAQVASRSTDQGTGNYRAYPLYIGRRGGTMLPFNGNLYGLIVRFGANLSAAQISNAERWMGRKTGVTI